MFEEKFGKVVRVGLPMNHCGCRYTDLKCALRMDQNESPQKAQPMAIDPERMKQPASKLDK